ncbi:hypothetical protein D9Q98_003720 [Chlorella vulgaris]|uniref:Response regulatory domain-containing protein n=1 Tax=Chlorella vulgaris TaxID=3077 RepID=A0A9D4TT53_CHLVU|nr:hypothetical protein D9Q98_003720 [Chlorella vulgaris]
MAGSQFPKGLRVLLVDELHSAASIRTQLESPSLQYTVTSVNSGSEALAYLRTGVAAFDVVLAESRIVAGDEIVGRSFIDSFEHTPVVLMSSCSTSEDVMRAVKLGAVDFLDKPLSHLKLKNIWQHSVRKMMNRASGPRSGAAAASHAATTPFTSWTAMPVSLFASSASTASLAAPESPGTPSAASADLAETFSMCSEDVSLRSSMDLQQHSVPAAAAAVADASGSFMDALTSTLVPPTASCASLPAAPLAGGTSAPPAVWPQLSSGCAWGTPAHGPVAPPLMAGSAAPAAVAPAPPAWSSAPMLHPCSPREAPVLIKHSASAAVLPVPAPASQLLDDQLLIPEGFLLDAAMDGKSASGPLGLQLKKSASLLDLINSALSSPSDHMSGATAMVF